MPPLPEDAPLFSLLEYAPDYLVRIPHAFYWVWLSIKHGSPTLPALTNPHIIIGGMAGESKTDLFALVGPVAREYFAPFVTVVASAAASEAEAAARAHGIDYPFIAKPDHGKNGRGVKIVRSTEELARHLSRFPATAKIILQRYEPGPGEAGVFYVRKPSEKVGCITSLTLKYFPSLVGDGHSTLRQLILADPRARKIAHIYLRRNAPELDRVIPVGKEHRLVSVGNHVRGALFINGAEHITPAMTAAFDRIAKDIKGFHFGRFDVRFASLDDLKQGKNFAIIEYNGASSEPTHVWDPRMKPLAIWRDLLYHWKLAFEVGAEHRAQGAKAPPLSEILRINNAENRLVAQYPDEE